MSDSTFRRLTQFARTSLLAKSLALLVLTSGTVWLAHGVGAAPPPKPPDIVVPAIPPDRPDFITSRPQIEAAFVLDTTGSMSGLIEGAKQKIWSIANQMASAEGNPSVRLALIGYRDRGDDYVTQVYDLSEDLDTLYAKLQSFEANGGGDDPESVNQALHEAVTKLAWSDAEDVYRVVFLVGDAPPHMDYSNDVPYTKTVRLASERGIVINTIQCGDHPEAQHVWRQIASLNQGKYAALAQDGAMTAVTAPQDEELSRLNRLLAENAVVYGPAKQQAELSAKLDGARAASPEVAASRLGYLTKQGRVLNSGAADLIDAIAEGTVALESVPVAEFPAPMQSMSDDERKDYVGKKAAERSKLEARVAELTADRDEYIAAKPSAPSAAGSDSFDANVLETIRTQAAEHGLKY